MSMGKMIFEIGVSMATVLSISLILNDFLNRFERAEKRREEKEKQRKIAEKKREEKETQRKIAELRTALQSHSSKQDGQNEEWLAIMLASLYDSRTRNSSSSCDSGSFSSSCDSGSFSSGSSDSSSCD